MNHSFLMTKQIKMVSSKFLLQSKKFLKMNQLPQRGNTTFPLHIFQCLGPDFLKSVMSCRSVRSISLSSFDVYSVLIEVEAEKNLSHIGRMRIQVFSQGWVTILHSNRTDSVLKNE